MSKKTEETGRLPNGQYAKGRKPDWSPPEGNDYASKYKEEYCEAIVEYFSKPPYETYTDENGREYVRPCAYPTFEGFAASIGVIAETMRCWCDKYERFRYSYQRAQDLQKKILLTNGLSGAYNPAFAKFVASCTMGMVEKSAVDIGNEGGNAFEVNIKVID